MIVAFARKSTLFHSASSIFDGFFSIPRRALYVLSFTSNDVIHIVHNKKLDLPSNFSTSNLVVMVILLAIALILIVVINADIIREKYRVGGSAVKV